MPEEDAVEDMTTKAKILARAREIHAEAKEELARATREENAASCAMRNAETAFGLASERFLKGSNK